MTQPQMMAVDGTPLPTAQEMEDLLEQLNEIAYEAKTANILTYAAVLAGASDYETQQQGQALYELAALRIEADVP